MNTCTNAPDYASGEDIKQVLKSEYRYFGTIDDVMEYIAERKEFERKLMKKSYRFPICTGSSPMITSTRTYNPRVGKKTNRFNILCKTPKRLLNVPQSSDTLGFSTKFSIFDTWIYESGKGCTSET